MTVRNEEMSARHLMQQENWGRSRQSLDVAAHFERRILIWMDIWPRSVEIAHAE
jgi:hypothetical protein